MREAPRSRPSDEAAVRVGEALDDGDWNLAEELLGETDCPYGCQVEPDGTCRHGFESAGRTAGLI
jgi:hypothetical protein